MNRECGGCTFCCKGSLTIPELNVYPGNPCSKVCESGCSIHKDPNRSSVCNTYECLWKIDEAIPDWMRPDKVNFVLSYTNDGIILVGDIYNEIKSSAFIWILYFCSKYKKLLHYTIKSAIHENMYERGTIFLEECVTYKYGTLKEIFLPIELCCNE